MEVLGTGGTARTGPHVNETLVADDDTVEYLMSQIGTLLVFAGQPGCKHEVGVLGASGPGRTNR